MDKMISWVEVPSLDFNRAVDFYKKVLQTEFNIIDSEKEKMACFITGEGCIFYAEGYKPSQDGTIVSFNTGDNIDAAIARVEKYGGKIVTPKTEIDAEGYGYCALFIDTEGNKVGLYGDK